MKNLLRFVAFLLIGGSAYAQSNLPACQGGDASRWSNCFGEITKDGQYSYIGDFLNGRFHGLGTMKMLAPNFNGDKYVGEFKDGSRSGQGTYTFQNGSKYVGNWNGNKQNGQGTLTLASGNKYAGEFKDGKRTGQGTFTFTNGSKYVGEFKDGKRNGQGTFTLANANKYVGEFKDDKYNGQGTFTFTDGTRYVGEFNDGKANGQGITTSTNGTKHVGQYKDDSYNGQGTFTFANGSKYVGEFKDDKRNGQGTLFAPNGSVISQGIWADEKLVRSVPVQQAAVPSAEPSSAERNRLAAVSKLSACPATGFFHNCFGMGPYDGGEFVGLWINGQPSGLGKFTDRSSNTWYGRWEYGFLSKPLPTFEVESWIQNQKSYANSSSPLASGIQTNTQNSQILNASAVNSSLIILSACQGANAARWSNCLGTFIFPGGDRIISEYQNGMRNGQGIEYGYDGTVLRSGTWKNDQLVSSHALDKSRFPFNPQTTTVAANNLPTYDFSKAERDRFTAEVEAERKKRQEIEQQLAAAKDRDRVTTELDAERRKRQELEEQLRVAQQSTQSNKQPVTSGIERRVALVIGNATYKINPLKNPVNDSTDMARSLRSVGFDVIEASNTTLAQMREVTRRFADKLSNSDVGLVYYSGHGVEVKGKNYLIPVNADIKREYEVIDQAFDASQFLEMMDNIRGPNNKRVNILIVDACRNNELQRSWRSTNNGLARMDAPGGTFISFATAPGRVAADGTGRNSPYTKHLLQALKQPNVPIEQVFKVVRRNVMEETKGEQIPWENSSLVGDFYFTVQR